MYVCVLLLLLHHPHLHDDYYRLPALHSLLAYNSTAYLIPPHLHSGRCARRTRLLMYRVVLQRSVHSGAAHCRQLTARSGCAGGRRGRHCGSGRSHGRHNAKDILWTRRQGGGFSVSVSSPTHDQRLLSPAFDDVLEELVRGPADGRRRH